MKRDYGPVISAVESAMQPDLPPVQRMQAVVDALWAAFGDDRGEVSWVGFYLGEAAGREMTLGPRRDKPACSPIGMHGVCGRCCLTGQVMVVADVRELGDNYVACDPRDRSEVVVPLRRAADGRAWAVLDLDSQRAGAFSDLDVTGLTAILQAAGLTL